MPAAKLKELDFSQLLFLDATFLEFSIKNNVLSAKKIGPIEGFSCQFSTNNTFSIEEKGIKVLLEVECEALSKDETPIGITGNFTIGFTFNVFNLEDYLIKSKISDDLIPGPEVVVPLVATAYSTARGMLLTRLLGTSLEGFALPIVKATDLLKDKPKTKKEQKEINK